MEKLTPWNQIWFKSWFFHLLRHWLCASHFPFLELSYFIWKMELITPHLLPYKLHYGLERTQIWNCFVNWKTLIKYQKLLPLLEPSGSCLDLQIDRISQHLLDLHKKQLLCLGNFFKALNPMHIASLCSILTPIWEFSNLFFQTLSHNRN